MAQEGGNDEEKWWLCIDKTGTLCRTKNVVSDPACMVIMEPNSGNQDWTYKYWTTHIIGAASGATVYKASFYPDFETLEALPDYETFVAIKVFKAKQTTEIQKLKQELQHSAFLAGHPHPNIIRIKTEFAVGDNLYVVMPFMAWGSLQSIISSRFPEGFPEECVRIALRETLKGLSYIHRMGQLHKNVDARYIFLCPYTPAIKLAFAASLYEQNTNFLGHGPSYAMPHCMWPAPEASLNYTSKADVWLVGITALQLGYGLRVANHNSMVAMVKNLRGNYPMEDQKFSKSFKHLVALCLDPNPSRRPQPDQLLRHRFFGNCQDVCYFSNMVKPPEQQNGRNLEVRRS